MERRGREHLLLAVVLATTSILYASGLDVAPFYIGGDEAHFAAHADSIAKIIAIIAPAAASRRLSPTR